MTKDKEKAGGDEREIIKALLSQFNLEEVPLEEDGHRYKGMRYEKDKRDKESSSGTETHVRVTDKMHSLQSLFISSSLSDLLTFISPSLPSSLVSGDGLHRLQLSP
ncbi:unnamed protein product [Pleuronectes platessa]|uniref:Uncharacterized protein n=1 Tax=Pleuronectes platessa TaxID=8262 RepID=A0A9N7Z2P7_PLEPL|nr:unnamed protein product [Pleuronectes platessa]